MHFARMAIQAGAKGLTVHPRPDLRHIHPSDVVAMADYCKQHNGVEFNIEGNPFAPANPNYPTLLDQVADTRPDQCTLVPDSESQKTSDHGFDLTRDSDRLIPIIEKLHTLNVRVSLFMDPDVEQIKLAKAVGADRIELYTGPFAWAYEQNPSEGKAIFAQHCAAAETALDLGLGINAGHDLNLNNMELYKTLPGLQEVSIGHALTVDALIMGFPAAVKAYLDVCA